MPLNDSDFVLGFDFGMRRIGTAVGTRESELARPLTCLAAQNGVPNWDEALALVAQWEAKALAVGFPLNMDGSLQNTSYAARRFANKLAAKTQLPAYLVDERLTSIEARRTIKEHKLSCDVDSYSAKLILEQWLTSKKATWKRSN